MMCQSVFAQRLDEASKSSGMPFSEIAREAGYAEATVRSYLRDGRRSSPKIEMVENLAEALDVNPAWLAGWSENKKRF